MCSEEQHQPLLQLVGPSGQKLTFSVADAMPRDLHLETFDKKEQDSSFAYLLSICVPSHYEPNPQTEQFG